MPKKAVFDPKSSRSLYQGRIDKIQGGGNRKTSHDLIEVALVSGEVNEVKRASLNS